jgi:hypothetical protein
VILRERKAQKKVEEKKLFCDIEEKACLYLKRETVREAW